MSMSPDPDDVENTKRQIRKLVNEISEISKTDVDAAEYYPAVLHRIIQALAARGGAIWLVDNDSGMKLASHIQYEPSLLTAESDDSMKHLRLLANVINRGNAELIPPKAVFGDDQSLANPTLHLLVLCPLAIGKKVIGLMEILQRPEAPPDTQRGYLKFLEHMAKLIAEWLKGQSLQQVSDRQVLWQQSDQFARLVHDNLDMRDTAYTIANEGRRLIECDRVSVATLRGGKAKVVAISGQDTIENRSNIVTALNALATRVIRSGEPLWYDGATEDLPPQIEEAVEEYVDLSHGRTIAVLPIHRPERTIEGDIQAKKSVPTEARLSKEIIGALIVEQIETQIPRDVLEGRVDLVYEHSCRALANTLSYNDLFLMPVWRTLGRATWFFRGSALPKTLSVLGLIALATVALFLISIDFDLEGNGELKPLVQRQVYAHIDGEVEEVLVKHGDVVKQDDPVVKLRNRDLEIKREELSGQWDVTNRRIATIPFAIQSSKDDIEKQKLSSEMAELQVKRNSLGLQLEVIKEKEIQLVRRAPISGIVTTWEVEKNLRSRPVATGQVLLSIADTEGDWAIEVDMPEKRMKYLDEAMAKTQEGYLPVDFILMTDPSVTRTGRLMADQVQRRAEVNAEQATSVKLRVIPDSKEELTRPGAKVIADVKCGKRSAAFVWFHEVIEWVRANLLF